MYSPYADVSNISAGRGGGAITAAAFLEKFTGSVPWAHLDIAGVAWGEGNDATNVKGATGFGVRALVQLARDW
jgi:leucyl aminopeptidase